MELAKFVLYVISCLMIATTANAGMDFTGLGDKAMNVPVFESEAQAKQWGQRYKGNGLYYAFLLQERSEQVRIIEEIEDIGSEEFTINDQKALSNAGMQITYLTIAIQHISVDSAMFGSVMRAYSRPVKEGE